jgi:heat shock protein HslJ
MKKITTNAGSLLLGIFLLIAIAGAYSFNLSSKNTTIVTPLENSTSTIVITPVDVKNSNYTVGGETFTMVNGEASKEIEGNTSSRNTLSIFGEPIYSDLNNDGVKDAAVLLVNNQGGSGTFYYAVLAIASGTTYTTTNALLLGDRIAPQTVEIRDNRAIFNYAIRKASDPMTTKPSIGKSLFVYYNPTTKEIGELVQNFEGEADTLSTMSLTLKKWIWVKTQMSDGTITTPKKANTFMLTFTKDGHFSASTDCNGMGGDYTTKGNKLFFERGMSTLMFCEGSQEQEFTSKLQNVESYLFTSKGELFLEIKGDSGTMIFK